MCEPAATAEDVRLVLPARARLAQPLHQQVEVVDDQTEMRLRMYGALSLGHVHLRRFVDAARAVGAGHIRLLTKHLLPNAAPAIAVSVTLAVGRAILLESALSFFGVGVRPPQASWGNMLYQAQATLGTEPWLALFPGLFIFVTALSVNLVGDTLAARQP